MYNNLIHEISDLPYTSLDNYRSCTNPINIEALLNISDSLKSKKIIEINATAYGGGVAELLQDKIALLRELGIDAHWLVLPPNEEFFKTTKALHNCLQGRCELPTQQQILAYQEFLREVATTIPKDGDLYVLHDPQTLGLAPYLPPGKVIWRVHIDMTEADKNTLDWIVPYCEYFKVIIISLEAYMQGLDRNKIAVIHPAINPYSQKNRLMPDVEQQQILNQYQLNNTPYLLQVSRFDQFKDPIGVLEIFTELSKHHPEMGCVLAGNYATDDPEGKPYYEQVKSYATKINNPNIHILTDLSDLAINALQSKALVILQNSNREGFGLTVTEALWKQKIVFSRPVGGIALQVINGVTGFYLGSTAYESADKIHKVITNLKPYREVGIQGKELVRHRYITPVMVANYLSVYKKALQI